MVDDPESILRCTNKVFLTELLARNRVAAPSSRIVHRANCAAVAMEIAYPCVLKRPDGAFSQGVVKVATPAEFRDAAQQMLTRSELIIAQEFLPTEFDWRVGVLAGAPCTRASTTWRETTGKSSITQPTGRVERGASKLFRSVTRQQRCCEPQFARQT